jgi:hypothetical protein
MNCHPGQPRGPRKARPEDKLREAEREPGPTERFQGGSRACAVDPAGATRADSAP